MSDPIETSACVKTTKLFAVRPDVCWVDLDPLIKLAETLTPLVPLDPEEPEVPDEPEVPEVPLVPLVPEVPEDPEEPEFPCKLQVCGVRGPGVFEVTEVTRTLKPPDPEV